MLTWFRYDKFNPHVLFCGLYYDMLINRSSRRSHQVDCFALVAGNNKVQPRRNSVLRFREGCKKQKNIVFKLSRDLSCAFNINIDI